MAARKKKTTRAGKSSSTGKSVLRHELLDKLRARSPEELADELVKLRKEQFSLRLQRATGQAPKPDQFGRVRKNIARLKTIAREAQLKAVAGVKK
jgi:large subunit ribosomal protein L29